jgi:hypothetical protein
MTEQQPATPAVPATPATPEAPPWGEDFDPAKAWTLIQNLRADKEKLAGRPVLDDASKAKLAEYERLEQASKTELERKTEELSRWQSEAEKWRSTSVTSTVKALAAADFADPDDAVRNLDAAKYLDAGGQVDEKAIQSDLAALLEAKPHYKRSTETTSRVPAPNRAQGSSNGTPSGDPGAEFAGILGGLLAR